MSHRKEEVSFRKAVPMGPRKVARRDHRRREAQKDRRRRAAAGDSAGRQDLSPSSSPSALPSRDLDGRRTACTTVCDVVCPDARSKWKTVDKASVPGPRKGPGTADAVTTGDIVVSSS